MPAEPVIFAERASAGSHGLVEALAQTPAGCSTAALELPPFSDESFPELVRSVLLIARWRCVFSKVQS